MEVEDEGEAVDTAVRADVVDATVGGDSDGTGLVVALAPGVRAGRVEPHAVRIDDIVSARTAASGSHGIP